MVNSEKGDASAVEAAVAEPRDNDLEAIPLVEVVGTAADGKAADVDLGILGAAPVEKNPLASLTKAELEAYVNDPFWRRLRLALMLLFAAVWLCLFAAVIVIVAASPKCPPRPVRSFWQRPIYRLQVPAFAPAGDADPAAVGSVEGLTRRLAHVRDTLGFSNLLLGGSLLPVGPSGCPNNFAALNPAVGTLESLKALTKSGRKKGFNLMMELDFSQADPSWAIGNDATAFAAASGDGGSGTQQLRSRDSGSAISDGRLHLPRAACNSLNVTAPAALSRLEAALTFWLDAGLSGFLITNVAFLSPSALTLDKLPNRTDRTLPSDDWFARDPSPVLYSNASVGFVRWVRRLLNRESSRVGRDLALLVDPGNTGFPQPAARLAAYLDPAEGAHAVVSVVLGQPLSDKAPKPPLAFNAEGSAATSPIETVLRATQGRGSVIFATGWPSLRRPADPLLTALSLTLPGVPCLYYGQELGMAHVPGVSFYGNGSYLKDSDSTDASETPMQWTGAESNAGWLAVASTRLSWVNLTLRAADIRERNLRRLAASGHPQSALHFTRQLLALASSTESLQWGSVKFLASGGSLVVFKRSAERYPAVLVVANSDPAPATVELGMATTGTLRLVHATGGDIGRIGGYRLGESYSLGAVFVPGEAALVFQTDAEP